jgi:hypothetical protein
MSELFREIKVQWEFQNRVMGGVPADPAVIAAWLETRGLAEKVRETIEETSGDPEAVPPEKPEVAKLVFKRNETGLYVDAYTVKAHLKDAANQIAKLLGVTALRSKVANKCYVMGEHLPLFRPTGEAIMVADGEYEHAIQVMTRQGPRSALKSNEFIETPSCLAFTLQVLKDGIITDEIIRSICEYGGIHGYGAERGLGYGRYQATFLEG